MGGPPARSRTSVALFIGAQLLLLAVIGLWAGFAVEREARRRALPEMRAEPLAIAPLRDDPEVVSDADLAAFLARLALVDRGHRTVVGHVDHVLRLWGPDVVFPDARAMSGADMLALLTDHRRFEKVYGSDEPPLLIEVEAGVRVRSLEGERSASHADHLLATLAEIGLPLEHPLHTPGGKTTLRAMLEQSLRDFDPQQAEYEWSALAYALYLPPVRRWRTAAGQEVDFDRLAERMMRERLPRGVCSGNHRLYGLTVLLRIDQEMAARGGSILTPASRETIRGFLADATSRLVEHQHRAGFWNSDWPLGPPVSDEPTGLAGDRLSDRIIATGHALEWWSIAPEELAAPVDVAIAAARWLVSTAAAMSDDEIQANISYLSHAGRGLAGWRGRRPAELAPPPPPIEAGE